MTHLYADRVLYEVIDRVALITLDRPELMNAFDEAMYQGINKALVAFRDDEDAWVAVIRATGERAFSAGADINALNANAEKGIVTGLGTLLLDHEMVTNKPIIAAVHGHCVGEGVNLVLGCDLVLADETAKFMVSEVRLGVNPVDIPLKLARRLGYAKAFSFLTPGDAKDARWAQDAGLVETVVPAGQVHEAAFEFARRICVECGPLAVRGQKEVLWRAVFDDEDVAREVGDTLRTRIRQSEDYAEGRRAFMEKRPPKFKGK